MDLDKWLITGAVGSFFLSFLFIILDELFWDPWREWMLKTTRIFLIIGSFFTFCKILALIWL